MKESTKNYLGLLLIPIGLLALPLLIYNYATRHFPAIEDPEQLVAECRELARMYRIGPDGEPPPFPGGNIGKDQMPPTVRALQPFRVSIGRPDRVNIILGRRGFWILAYVVFVEEEVVLRDEDKDLKPTQNPYIFRSRVRVANEQQERS